jgi:hypothetical protein
MDNRQRRFVCDILLVVGTISIGLASPLQLVYAHSFSGSESASFLSLVHKIRVESGLVLDNVGNATLARQHAENAAKVIDNQTIDEISERNNRIADDLSSLLQDLQTAAASTPIDAASINDIVSNLDATLGEAVSVRIDQEQLNNSTTQAIVLADVIDEVLRNYGSALEVGFDMTNMSLMDEMVQDNNSGSGDSGGMEGGGSTQTEGNTSTSTVVNMSAYQSAQAFANKSLEIFQNDLKPLSPPPSATAGDNNSSNLTAAISQIEGSLVKLQQAINNKASPEEIIMIVHAEIHPNIQIAYKLQLLP